MYQPTAALMWRFRGTGAGRSGAAGGVGPSGRFRVPCLVGAGRPRRSDKAGVVWGSGRAM